MGSAETGAPGRTGGGAPRQAVLGFGCGGPQFQHLLHVRLVLVVGYALLRRVRENAALEARDVLTRDGEEFTEVVRQVRKVEKRVLFLADVYESGPDGRHHVANTG